jgi:hypothetical protein
MKSIEYKAALILLKKIDCPFNDSETYSHFAKSIIYNSMKLFMILSKNADKNRTDWKEFRRDVESLMSYKEIFKEIKSIKINHKLKEKTKTINNKVVIQVLFESFDWSAYLERTKKDPRFTTHRGNQYDEVTDFCRNYSKELSKYISENLATSFNTKNSKHKFITDIINIQRNHYKLGSYDTQFITKLLKP